MTDYGPWIVHTPGERTHIAALEARVKELTEALTFYGDPESYAAILVIADRPAGAFADDISETSHPDWETSYGAIARRALIKEKADG